jgi:hypothetical protein
MIIKQFGTLKPRPRVVLVVCQHNFLAIFRKLGLYSWFLKSLYYFYFYERQLKGVLTDKRKTFLRRKH